MYLNHKRRLERLEAQLAARDAARAKPPDPNASEPRQPAADADAATTALVSAAARVLSQRRQALRRSR